MNETSAATLVGSTLARGVQSAVPLLLAANGELIAERAGLINIGIEGAMLTGAFVASAAAVLSGSPLVGVSAALLAGAIVGLLFAVWTVWAGRDQIITGLGINLLAIGLTGVALRRLERWCALTGRPSSPPPLAISPIDGMMIVALLLPLVTHVLLFHSRPGLSLRAVGENPHAAETAGVRVHVVRVLAGVVGSALSAAAGAYLSLGIARQFQEEMTGGRGFLALALVIFGRWSPLPVLAAALFFGCLDALQVTLQPGLGRWVHLMYPALLALPYLLTLAVLAGFAGRSRSPASLGTPFVRT